MDITLTESLAMAGTTLGVANLFWNMWVWRRNRPDVEATVTLREVGFDEQICYEIRNRGGQPTTIEEIRLVKYQDGLLGWIGMLECIEYIAGKRTFKLPELLPAGGAWKGVSPIGEERRPLEMDKVSLVQEGKLFYKIRLAHQKRLLSGRVKAESFLPFIWAT